MILARSPYGSEETWNALRLAQALVSVTMKTKVNIFLVGDAVATAKKGQKPPEGYYNLEKMLSDLDKHGVKAMACRTCVHARGLTEADLAEGVQIGTMMDLAHWVEESQKVLSF